MMRCTNQAPVTGLLSIFGVAVLLGVSGIAVGAEEGPTVAFRAKAELLPAEASVAQGKAPDEIVEIVLPGRVYQPPITVAPVKTRRDANWKTPEQASASDFSAFREGDPEWLRENFVEEDYSDIQRMVEDPNIRRLNQNTYMNYREKTILSRCEYKDFALVFAQYDGVATRGVIEVYRRVKRNWKRTNSLAQDETIAALQSMFRQGTIEQISR